MSCCGKIVVLSNIAEGSLKTLASNMMILPKNKYKFSDTRLDICRKCENHTWLTWYEYWQWVKEHGRIEKFFRDIDNLIEWPLLPKNTYKKKTRLFCRICKCWLPARARLEGQECTLGLWKGVI